MKRFLLLFLLPLSAWAVTRSVTISAPASVVTGQSFLVSTAASTDAGAGEQVGFYHAEYSTNGGASWSGFCYDVNVGASATRNAYITSGGVGSTILVRVRIAFRGGPAGDVDYNGNALDWSGTWTNWQTPPTKYATITVVAPPNQAPTIAWAQNPASAYVNQWFVVQARGDDLDGNLSAVFVWKDWTPYAFNGGGNGYQNYSDANQTYGSAPGAVSFQAQAGDNTNTLSPLITHSVTINNRTPYGTTLSGSGAGVTMMPNGQYEMWANNPITLTAGLHDYDGNLSFHGIWHNNGTGITDGSAWVQLSNTGTPSNGADSTLVRQFTPTFTGRWDFHTNGYDNGALWAGGSSITVYVYGLTNNSAFVSQVINGTTNPTTLTLNTGQTVAATITMSNTGDKPWSTDATPHRLGSQNPTDNMTWGVGRVALPSSPINPPPQANTAAFAFNFTAPTVPGTYQFQWRMVEDGIQWFGATTPSVTVTVVDNSPPTTPSLQSTGKTVSTIALSWTGSTDNSGTVAGYKIYRNGGATPVATITSGLTFTDSSLTANTTYTYTVKAYDPSNNLSGASNTVSVTTDLDPAGDNDSDGIPNGWEQANGLNPLSGNDAGQDPDNDGLTNVAEYNLGKNPNSYDAGTSTLGGAVPAGWPNVASNTVQAVGATAGELSVDKSGALTYSVPIWTTPGTAGMEPKMSLNYSSQSGAGIAGFGWSLSGTSAITRGGQTLAIDGRNQGVTFTSADRFYLDGQRLILISGTYGADGSEYRTEIDSFTKVVAYGTRGSGPARFKAQTKSGLTIWFGNPDDNTTNDGSTFDAYGRAEPFSWCASKISDSSGNYMAFIYTEVPSNGEHRLSRIDYTGNGASIPTYASLRFEYEDRDDWTYSYSGGSPVASFKRLSAIKSYYGEMLGRSYALGYTVRGTANPRSMLTSITETGYLAGVGKSYPPLTFDYEAAVGGWNVQSATVPFALAQKDTPLGAGLMDLNGDGYADFIRKKISGTSTIVFDDALLNTPTGWVANTSYQPTGILGLAWQGRSDAGARFIDLDGDGLVDIIAAFRNSNGLIDSYAQRNTGSGWAAFASAAIPTGTSYGNTTYITDNGKEDSGRRFVDVNGDGLPDLVWNCDNPVESGCLINNINGQFQAGGPAWVPDNRWAPPMVIMGKFSSGSQFFDVNGDGLPDQVQHGIALSGIEAGVALNSPTGFNSWNRVTTAITTPFATYQAALGAVGTYLPPVLLSQDGANYTATSIGSELVDLNGDGLVDVIMSNPYLSNNLGAPRAFLNTGGGWAAATAYNPQSWVGFIGRSSGVTDPTGASLADLNGDGLPDIAVYRADQASYYFLNTGHGWGSMNSSYLGGADLSLPAPLVNSDFTYPTGTQLADLNGDGVLDVVRAVTQNGVDTKQHWLNGAKPTADKLIKVTNGMGVSAAVSYALLNERDAAGNPTVYTKGSGATYPLADLTGPMVVVKSVSHDDGVSVGGVMGQYQLTYRYAGLRSHALRGSLGFASMSVTDSRTSIKSQTDFSQTYPYIGMPLVSATTLGAQTLSSTSVVYGERLLNGGATHFVFAANTLAITNDLDGTPTSTVNTTVNAGDIDAYGNILTITVNADDFVKTTTSTYDNDLVNWFLGRLRTATVTTTAPSGYGLPAITRSSSFTYAPTTGLLATETVEPNDPKLALTTTYGYDQFGNKTSVTVSGASVSVSNANGDLVTGPAVSRTTTTQYDFHGRNPIWTRNALNHQEDYYVYDEPLGVLKHMGGANGVPTLWTYDEFGRKLTESRGDGTATYTTYRWVNSAPAQAKYDGPTPTPKYQVETAATGAPSAIAFYDAFGRSYLSLGINGDGKIVYQTKQFDNQGRTISASTPYFGSTPTAEIGWARTTLFDALNRPKTTETPDDAVPGKVTSYSAYSGLQATVTDPKGRVARTIKNSQGWTIQNIRNETALGGAPASSVSYEYDAVGNLTKTTAAGVVTTLSYDLRGRKEQMVDADMGTWLYRYNIFGELIWQKDAKGQITTMAYDSLGRLTSRVERNDANTADETTTWTYDTAPRSVGQVWKGKLASVSAVGGYAETYTYDAVGRPSTLTRTIDGTAYTSTSTYDSASRPLRTIYPATGIGSNPVSTRNVYNGFGYLKEVRNYLASDDGKPNDQLQGLLYWQADSYGVTGRVDGETYGNGLSSDRYYSPITGRLQRATVDRGLVIAGPYAIQDLNYTYDAVGNVTRRLEQTTGVARDEQFSFADGSDGYDGLDRLRVHRVVTGTPTTVTVTYDAQGNITNKSDVGNYTYNAIPAGATVALAHAVSAAGTKSYTYDRNGNMLTGTGRTLAWTSFNQLRKATDTTTNKSSEFTFGAGHERIKQVRKTGTTVNDTTIYVGGLFEKVTTTTGTLVEYKHYIMAPTGRVAVVTQSTANAVVQANTTRYFHTDGLGSITVVSDEAGRVLTRYTYDAWGKQTSSYTNPTSGLTNLTPTTRGFTDHEMLSNVGLIHMNGRVYDPTLGRFLSADPNIDGVSDAQGYNRYSYVGNNPLGATDPTGYWSLKDILPAIIGIVVAVVATVVLGPGGATFWKAFVAGLHEFGAVVGAGAAGGFASGFSGSLLNGGSLGDAFKAGVIGGLWGAATAAVAWGVGQYFDGLYPAGTAASDMTSPFIEGGRALAHGATQGALTEAQGGEFRHGFFAAAFSSAAGSITGHSIKGRDGWAITKRTIISATVGGTASVLGGGKFANGATTGAFQHLFNSEAADFFNNIRRDAQSQGWGWAIYDNLLLPAALGAQAGVAGFNNAITFGLSGTGGFDPYDEGFQTGRMFGKATLMAEAIAVPVGAWAAAGAPTMTIAYGAGHVAYGTGGVWLHATYIGGSRMLTVTMERASVFVDRFATRSVTLPVLYPQAVLQTGQPASNCVAPAAKAFAKGWGF